MKKSLLVLVLCATEVSSEPIKEVEPILPPINKQVLKVSQAHLGKKVESGECWKYVQQMLRIAGAEYPGRKGPPSWIFGKEITSKEVLPGDVVTFFAVTLDKHDSKGQLTNKLITGPTHVAVIEQYERDGEIWIVLHSNHGGSKRAVRTDLSGYKMTTGKIFYYRPIKVGR